MRYPGGKGKCFQHVINLMPPHRVYIETHLGGGAVLRHKRPAERSFGIDRDPSVVARWLECYPGLAEYRIGDGVEFLRNYEFRGDELVYVDPPYVPTTRRRSRVYRYDYGEEEHRVLLGVLRELPCATILSGYWSRLYETELKAWGTREFRAKTHSGLRSEVLWFNFPHPTDLHDYSYLGRDFREREAVRRRLAGVKRRLGRLSPVERSAVRRWLETDGRA